MSLKAILLPLKRKACTKYVQEKGWTLIDEYTDRGESARSAHRPMLQEMLKRVKEDKSINAVVVRKIDRLARNLKDHVEITATLQKAKVGLVSIVENIEDTAKPFSYMPQAIFRWITFEIFFLFVA